MPDPAAAEPPAHLARIHAQYGRPGERIGMRTGDDMDLTIAAPAPADPTYDCIVSVDGEEFIRDRMTVAEARCCFRQTVDSPDTRNAVGQTEYALQVFRADRRGFLRLLWLCLGPHEQGAVA